jgi:hypothetical protein
MRLHENYSCATVHFVIDIFQDDQVEKRKGRAPSGPAFIRELVEDLGRARYFVFAALWRDGAAITNWCFPGTRAVPASRGIGCGSTNVA